MVYLIHYSTQITVQHTDVRLYDWVPRALTRPRETQMAYNGLQPTPTDRSTPEDPANYCPPHESSARTRVIVISGPWKGRKGLLRNEYRGRYEVELDAPRGAIVWFGLKALGYLRFEMNLGLVIQSFS